LFYYYKLINIISYNNIRLNLMFKQKLILSFKLLLIKLKKLLIINEFNINKRL